MAFVEIDRFYDLPSGHVAASALRAAGIPAVLQGAEMAGGFPLSIAWEGGLRLRVLEEDVAEAQEILRAAKPPESDTPGPTARERLPLALATVAAWWMTNWGTGGLGMTAHRLRPTPIVRAGLVIIWIGVALFVLRMGAVVLAVMSAGDME